MSISKSKEKILKGCNYRYHFTREIYFNTETKKIFSAEAVDDNDEDWLKKGIQEKNTQQWQFYFSGSTPPDALKIEIIIAGV